MKECTQTSVNGINKQIHNDCRDHFIGGLLYKILKDPWKASVIRRLEILADGHQRCEHFEYEHDEWGAQDLLTKKLKSPMFGFNHAIREASATTKTARCEKIFQQERTNMYIAMLLYHLPNLSVFEWEPSVEYTGSTRLLRSEDDRTPIFDLIKEVVDG